MEIEDEIAIPPQQQNPPNSQEQMQPPPVDEDMQYVGTEKLRGKVAIITGGDSGIGRSVALLFAKEGANICLVYLNEAVDADLTAVRIEEIGGHVLQLAGDLGDPQFCAEVVQKTLKTFGRIDIVINNAGEQIEMKGVADLEPESVEQLFRTNLFSMFYLTKAALPYLKTGATIINTTSLQAYDPSPQLMGYACTKAAILNFTRSLAKELAPKKIRVNAVAPGPIWTPLIPTTFEPEELKTFGDQTEMERPGQPAEVAPAYLFLAAESSASFITGQVVHVNGGQGMFS